jgi:hypothetical protein
MRREPVSVTALSEFSTCETRRMLRESMGERWTDQDRIRLDAGDQEHARFDRTVRAFGIPVWRRLIVLSRMAVLTGIPLTIVGLVLNALVPSETYVRILVHAVCGPGIAGTVLLGQTTDIPERVIVFALLQFLYYLTLVTLIRRVFDR